MAFTQITHRERLHDIEPCFEAHALIRIALALYATSEPPGVGMDNTVYTLASTSIDLYLSLLPWVCFPISKNP